MFLFPFGAGVEQRSGVGKTAGLLVAADSDQAGHLVDAPVFIQFSDGGIGTLVNDVFLDTILSIRHGGNLRQMGHAENLMILG